MTLQQIKDACAAYFGTVTARTSADLTVNGVDLFLLAANQARRMATSQYDFEFLRSLVDVTVDGVSGGSLALATAHGTVTPTVVVGAIVDVGLFDDVGNLIPVEWTTTAESLERQRQENRYGLELSATPATIWPAGTNYPYGQRRVTFTGDNVYVWPKATGKIYTVGVEAYNDQGDDWTDVAGNATVAGTTGVVTVNGTYALNGVLNGRPLYFNTATAGTAFALWFTGTVWRITYATDLGNAAPTNYAQLTGTGNLPSGAYTPHGTFTGAPTVTAASVSNIWTTVGQQFLLWQTIIQLNYLFVSWVPRSEGSLPPPTQLATAGLEALRTWDASRFEQSRRHGR